MRKKHYNKKGEKTRIRLTCKKIIFNSIGTANQIVLDMKQNKHVKNSELLDSYYCKECKGWHVGNNRYKKVQK